MKQDNDRKDVPRKTGVIAAVLAALLVAAVATVFVVSAKRGSGPVTTDMAALDSPTGDTAQGTQSAPSPEPTPANEVAEQGMPAGEPPVAEPGVAAPDQPMSSEASVPQGAGGAEPVSPSAIVQPPEAGLSTPGSAGSEGVPTPAVAPEPGAAPVGVVGSACEFPQFVGLSANDMKVEEVIKARSHRLLPPGSAVTQDHAPDRINLELDDQGVIRRVWCG